MITYQVESVIESRNEFHELFEFHWEEIARHKDTIKLNPDYEAYQRLEEAQVLRVVTARDEGKLVGYIANMVTPNLHYKDHLMATNDVLYLHPDYRRGGTFIRMLDYTEDYLAEIGVINFYIHMKVRHDFSQVLERRGYTEIERNFEKQLQEPRSWQ